MAIRSAAEWEDDNLRHNYHPDYLDIVNGLRSRKFDKFEAVVSLYLLNVLYTKLALFEHFVRLTASSLADHDPDEHSHDVRKMQQDLAAHSKHTL